MGVKFEHYIEMLDGQPLLSTTLAVRPFYRTYITLNPSDYDDATFYLECVETNSSGTPNITLWNVTTAAAITTITLGTDTVKRVRSASFTPTAGANTYCISLPAVSTISVWSARIVVVQGSSATKTRI